MAEIIDANKEYIPTEKSLNDLASMISAANNNIESNILTDRLLSGEVSIDAKNNTELPTWSQVSSSSVRSVNEKSVSDLFTLNNLIKSAKPELTWRSKGNYGAGLTQYGANIYDSTMAGGGALSSANPVAKSTLPQIMTDLVMRGFNFGYYYFPGFSMTRDDSPWYITIGRHGFNDELSAEKSVQVGSYDNLNKSTGLDRLPHYLVTVGDLLPTYFDFSSMAPCVSCSINLGESRMSKVELFRGQSFDVPDGFSIGHPTIKLQMLDDERGSLRKYLMAYQKKIYDIDTNTVADWRSIVFDINLVMLRPGPEIDYSYTFYGILQDFDYQFELGSRGVGDMSIIDMPFSIVGARISGLDVVYKTEAPGFINLGEKLNMSDISVFKCDNF